MLKAENRRHNSLTLRQVPPFLQRILLRAKRKPGSLYKASVPEDSPALCAHSREDVDCRKRPREARECAKAHSFMAFRDFFRAGRLLNTSGSPHPHAQTDNFLHCRYAFLFPRRSAFRHARSPHGNPSRTRGCTPDFG